MGSMAEYEATARERHEVVMSMVEHGIELSVSNVSLALGIQPHGIGDVWKAFERWGLEKVPPYITEREKRILESDPDLPPPMEISCYDALPPQKLQLRNVRLLPGGGFIAEIK